MKRRDSFRALFCDAGFRFTVVEPE